MDVDTQTLEHATKKRERALLISDSKFQILNFIFQIKFESDLKSESWNFRQFGIWNLKLEIKKQACLHLKTGSF